MRPGMIRILFRRELRHFLRDRRTVFSLILAPVVMSCLVLGGMGFFLSRSLHNATAQPVRLSIARGLPGFAQLSGLVTASSADPIGDVREGRADAALAPGAGPTDLVIYGDFVSAAGVIRRKRIEDVLHSLRDSLVAAQLDHFHVPRSVLLPFTTRIADASPKRSNLLMVLAPFLLLQFLIAGSIYPAIDLTAGERERRTMELSLSAPVSAAEIVTAKFLTVLTSATVSSTFALLTFFLTLRVIVARAEGPFAKMGQVAADPALWFIAVLIAGPLIALLAASALALAAAARSSQEASSYLSPFAMVALVLSMLSFIPGGQTGTLLALVPLANWIMLTRDLFGGSPPWPLFIICGAANLVYAAIAWRLAVSRFNNESVMFRS